MNEDICEAIQDWDFEPEALTVRKIMGDDGTPKIQMRLELGLIQMEFTGRPDGARPRGAESYLHYYKDKLDRHIRRTGSPSGFKLGQKECGHLQSESLLYYYRYLSLFHLGEFEQVVADTARNLEAAEFLKRHAETEEDRYSIEQYRAYILMMNSQAKARLAREQARPYDALGIVREGIRKIRRFLDESAGMFGNEDDSHELRLLHELEKEILNELPDDSVEKLHRELEKAVAEERFEKAATLRDRIRALEAQK
jgi:hypothetical protein